ncbi:MAG: hypothetical protein MZV70_52030 [Desulfobacterales bacterium]|nr:hypothetical protein [Desulfobacterales bacterium]
MPGSRPKRRHWTRPRAIRSSPSSSAEPVANKNGDHFTPDELAARYMTAINKKIDLKHSQDFTDIVGGIVGADYVEDETGGRDRVRGRTLCLRQLRTPQLAYKLIRKGIISQVSMECDYEEGECSICRQDASLRRAITASTCARTRAADFQGQAGLRDPPRRHFHRARASRPQRRGRKRPHPEGRRGRKTVVRQPTLKEVRQWTRNRKDTEEQAAEAAKKKDDRGGGTALDDKTRLKELERENKELKQQVLALQKQLEELEAEKKAAANRSRAQKLLRKIEKSGLAFESDEDRGTGAEPSGRSFRRRLRRQRSRFRADDEGRFPRSLRGQGREGPRTRARKTTKASCGCDGPAPAQRRGRPSEGRGRQGRASRTGSKSGFMAAYRQRVATATGEPVSTN